MSRLLYLDCFSGASGDMLLGAFVDLGVPLEELRRALGTLLLDGVDLRAERVLRAGVSATKVDVVAPPGRAHDQHGHHPDHHAPPDHHAHDGHRSVDDIAGIVARSGLSSPARQRTMELVRRLAETEAAIHAVPVEHVHLHEVGAIDSIVDIACGVFAFEWLGVDSVAASPLNVGSGTVRCAHGVYPVPAPATASLVRGVPVYGDGPMELLTPTGALLVTGFATSFGALPPMRIERVGYGAGSRDLQDRPNVLRAVLGTVDAAAATAAERVVVIEFEVDDMNPQLFGPLMDTLYAHGALEVFYAPVQMKKNRPGVLVTLVADPRERGRLAEIVFRETTTIGLRYHEMQRECLARVHERVDTPWGAVRVKVARRLDAPVNVAPEFEDCARLAAAHDIPLKDIQAWAIKAYLEQHPPRT